MVVRRMRPFFQGVAQLPLDCGGARLKVEDQVVYGRHEMGVLKILDRLRLEAHEHEYGAYQASNTETEKHNAISLADWTKAGTLPGTRYFAIDFRRNRLSLKVIVDVFSMIFP